MEVDDPQPIVERVATVDVAKTTGTVCTRVPHDRVAGKCACQSDSAPP